MEYQVKLNSIEKVENFVNIVNKQDEKYELISDAFIINAKSILGIFSLDLTKSLNHRTSGRYLPHELKQFLG